MAFTRPPLQFPSFNSLKNETRLADILGRVKSGQRIMPEEAAFYNEQTRPVLSAPTEGKSFEQLGTGEKYKVLTRDIETRRARGLSPDLGQVGGFLGGGLKRFGERTLQLGEEFAQRAEKESQTDTFRRLQRPSVLYSKFTPPAVIRGISGAIGMPAKLIGTGIEELSAPHEKQILGGKVYQVVPFEKRFEITTNLIFGGLGLTPGGSAFNAVLNQPIVEEAFQWYQWLKDSAINKLPTELRDPANLAVDTAVALLIRKGVRGALKKNVPGFAPSHVDPQTGRTVFAETRIPVDREWWGNIKQQIAQDISLLRANPVEFIKEKGVGLSIKDVSERGKMTTLKAMGGMPSVTDQGVRVAKPLPELTTRVLNALGTRSTVSRQFIQDLTNMPELRQSERDLIRSKLAEISGDTIDVQNFANSVQEDLLPLKRMDAAAPAFLDDGRQLPFGYKYEAISLPKEQRGNVQNYSEYVYSSPIETAAGDVHYSKERLPNYFAHTRIEDLPPDGEETIRRVIEVQSDLLQKGKLEGEVDDIALTELKESGLTPKEYDKTYSGGQPVMQDAVKRRDAIQKKLEPYRNTWYERIIREEVKKAAQDGKTKIQFPTGETAMKIEGLGDNSARWRFRLERVTRGRGENPYDALTSENLKVGREVFDGQSEWIITNVLGDGKFKAIPKDKISNYELQELQKGKYVNDVQNAREVEEFDISGKVDTNNPIYKFYEKEIAKFLKREFPQTKLVTDKQGVTWNEVDISRKPNEIGYGERLIFALKTGGKRKLTTGEITERAQQKKSAADLEKQVVDIYKSAGKDEEYPEFYKADKVFSEIYTELDLSEAGYRFQTGDGEFSGVPSSFPKWIPESLRSKELFQKVFSSFNSVDDIKFPVGNRSKQRALYDILLHELDKRLGVNTQSIRDQIITNYDESGTKAEIAKSSDRSIARGEGQGERREPKRLGLLTTIDEATQTKAIPDRSLKNIPFTEETIKPFQREIGKGLSIEKGKDFLRKHLDSKYLQRFGDEGKMLSGMIDESDRLAAFKTGEQVESIATNLRKLSSNELVALKNISEGKIVAGSISPKTQETFRMWDNIRKDIADRAKQFGLKIKTAAGAEFDFMARENYFPRFVKDKYLLKIINNPKSKEKFFLDMVKESNGRIANITEAERIFTTYISKRLTGTYGNLEKAREADLPHYVYENDPRKVLPEYIARANKRLAEAEVFGPNYEKRQQLIENFRAKGGNSSLLQQIFDRMAQREKFDPTVENISSAVRGFEVITKLDLSAITNLADIVKPFIRTNWTATFKAIVQAFTKEGEARSAKSGITLDNLKHLENEIGEHKLVDKFMKLVKFEYTESKLRTIGANAGRNYAEILFKKLQKNPDNRFAKRRLEQLGVNAQEALNRGNLNENDLNIAGYQAVKDMQPMGRQEVPFYWQSPLGKVLSQFKSFAYKQAKFTSEFIFKEAGRGNIKPLLTFLVLGLAVGEGVADLKAFVRRRERPTDLLGRILDNYMTVGGLGLATDFLNNIQHGQLGGGFLKFIAGPTLTDIDSLLTSVSSDIQSVAAKKEFVFGEKSSKGKVQPKTLKMLLRNIPIVGKPLTNTIFPAKQPYKARTIPIGEDIFDLFREKKPLKFPPASIRR